MKRISFMFLTLLATISFSNLAQESRLSLEPKYDINKKDVSLNLKLKSNLWSTSNGYYGELEIAKNKINLKNFNLHYSEETQVKTLVGYKFLKDKKVSPYFDLSFYPAKKFVTDYRTYDYRDFETNIGLEYKDDKNKIDTKIKYIGNLLIIPSSVELDIKYEYKDEKLKTSNFFKLENIFGERYFPGFSSVYKNSFLYDYSKLNKNNYQNIAISTKINSKNEYRIIDDLNFIGEFDMNHITQFKTKIVEVEENNKMVDKINKRNYTMLDLKLLAGIKFSKYLELDTNISNETLLFFNYNNLRKNKYEFDKYYVEKKDEEKIKSKEFFEFPDNLIQTSKPIINIFKINTKIGKNLNVHKNINIKPGLELEIKHSNVFDIAESKNNNKTKIEIIPNILFSFKILENFGIDLETNIDMKFENGYIKENENRKYIGNYSLNNKITAIYKW